MSVHDWPREYQLRQCLRNVEYAEESLTIADHLQATDEHLADRWRSSAAKQASNACEWARALGFDPRWFWAVSRLAIPDPETARDAIAEIYALLDEVPA